MKTIKKAAVLLATAAMLASGGALATATTASAATTYSCSNETYAPNPISGGSEYSEFGYYSGNAATPSGNQFSWAAVEAQCLLNTLGYNLTVDGYAGPNTQAAVLAYQQEYQIFPEDGLLGPITWPHLRESAR